MSGALEGRQIVGMDLHRRRSVLVRVQRLPGHTRLGGFRDQVGARRGRNIGVVAAARQLIELVFYGLRDGHIRALAAPPAGPAA